MHRDNWRGGSDAEPHWSGLPRWDRLLLGAAGRAWTGSPWAVLAFAGAAVALHRWPGLLGSVSALWCVGAGWSGWRLLWRAAEREVDVNVAEALLSAGVADPEPWALFPQREELIKAAHWSRCLRRWGVNPRSSGWERVASRARWGVWREAALALLVFAPAALHPWWL